MKVSAALLAFMMTTAVASAAEPAGRVTCTAKDQMLKLRCPEMDSRFAEHPTIWVFPERFRGSRIPAGLKDADSFSCEPKDGSVVDCYSKLRI